MARLGAIWSVLSLLISCMQAMKSEPKIELDARMTFDELFNLGVNEYSNNEWAMCIVYMEKALEDFHLYESALLVCRLQCNTISEVAADFEAFDEAMLDTVFQRAECLKSCKRESMAHWPGDGYDSYIIDSFYSRQPYTYLQMAYYQNDQIEKAASAAFTYLMGNPEDATMAQNVDFYRNVPVAQEHFKDLEIRPYQEHFIKGHEAYESQNWTGVIHHIEKAVKEYYQAVEECRALCEGPYRNDGFPDMYIAIAENLAHALQCKLNCPEKLALVRGSHLRNHLAHHYHYLQYAYYQVGNLGKATECVSTYLLFKPDDEVMISNMMFYEQQDSVDGHNFQPRKEALRYHRQLSVDNRMRKNVEKINFEENEDEEESQAFFEDDSEEEDLAFLEDGRAIDSGAGDKSQERVRKGDRGDLGEGSEDTADTGIQVIMRDNDLNGVNRMAADGFATDTECQQLIELASDNAIEGDGYNGNPSPHTQSEFFTGLTLVKAAEIANKGIVGSQVVKLYSNLTENARKFVQQYFKLHKEIFHTYTHLVCRTSKEEDENRKKNDMSHPIHSDNCILDNKGNCDKKPPAYTWRDWSALVYLNNNFEGGEFIFANNKKTIESKLNPKCGRLVGFSADNYHGVLPVTKGTRCALAMWYTYNQKYDQHEHEKANAILESIKLRDEL